MQPIHSHYDHVTWRLLWKHFWMGTFQGIGFLLGSALVLTLVGFLLQHVLGEIPFLSDFAEASNAWLQMNAHR